jgi:hypothetical protein
MYEDPKQWMHTPGPGIHRSADGPMLIPSSLIDSAYIEKQLQSIWQRLHQTPANIWRWISQWQTKPHRFIWLFPDATEQGQARNDALRSVLLSGCSLVVATGGLVIGPVGWVALPLLAYLGVSMAQRTLRTIGDGQAGGGLLDVAVVSVCVVQGFTVAGSLYCIFHYGNRYLLLRKGDDLPHQPDLSRGSSPPFSVPKGASAFEAEWIHTAHLRRGHKGREQARVTIHPGETMPQFGLVVEGVGLVQGGDAMEQSVAVPRRPGDVVPRGSMLLAGRLIIESAAPTTDDSPINLPIAEPSPKSGSAKGVPRPLSGLFTLAVLGAGGIMGITAGAAAGLAALNTRLGVDAPLTSAHARARVSQDLIQRGIWVRRPVGLERLPELDTLMLDLSGCDPLERKVDGGTDSTSHAERFRQVVRRLRHQGVKQIYLLVEEDRHWLRWLAQSLGVILLAQWTEESKSALIQRLQANGHRVGYFTDRVMEQALHSPGPNSPAHPLPPLAEANFSMHYSPLMGLASPVAQVISCAPSRIEAVESLDTLLDLAKQLKRTEQSSWLYLFLPGAISLAGVVTGQIGPLGALFLNQGAVWGGIQINDRLLRRSAGGSV